MQFLRTVACLAHGGYGEVLCQQGHELQAAVSVEVLHNAVVVEDGQLACREADSHEVVVLLVATVVGVLLCLLCTHQSGGGTTMVAVGNIQVGNFCKGLGNSLLVLLVLYEPQLMAETVGGGGEVIFRLVAYIACYDGSQGVVVGIGKEDRLHVGIVHADMLHAVFLLVAACQFVLLDDTVHVVVHVGTYHQTELCLAVHGLCIDIVSVLLVLYQPAVVLELLEVLCSLGIHLGCIFAGTDGEVYLRLDDMVKALLVALGLGAGLFRVQYVVGA